MKPDLPSTAVPPAPLQHSLRPPAAAPAPRNTRAGWHPAFRTGLLTLAVLAVTWQPIKQRLGSRASGVIGTLQRGGLNKEDLSRMQRGYYEDLMGVSRFNSPLWETYMLRPPWEDWPRIWQTAAGRSFPDFLGHALLPSASINYLGAPLSTNRWGMRDRDYDLRKPPNTTRIALMGASIEMGYGVGDREVFESIAEERLNGSPPVPGRRVEVLNFSVAGYWLPHQLATVHRVLEFSPDFVVVASHLFDDERAVDHLAQVVDSGIAIPFEDLRRAVDSVVDRRASKAENQRRLRVHTSEFVAAMYRALADSIRAHGAMPVILLIPRADLADMSDLRKTGQIAARAGFGVWDLTEAYRGHPLQSVQLTAFDDHPNVRGHGLLADEFERAIRRSLGARSQAAGASTP